jgi:hypothetical protein
MLIELSADEYSHEPRRCILFTALTSCGRVPLCCVFSLTCSAAVWCLYRSMRSTRSTLRLAAALHHTFGCCPSRLTRLLSWLRLCVQFRVGYIYSQRRFRQQPGSQTVRSTLHTAPASSHISAASALPYTASAAPSLISTRCELLRVS